MWIDGWHSAGFVAKWNVFTYSQQLWSGSYLKWTELIRPIALKLVHEPKPIECVCLGCWSMRLWIYAVNACLRDFNICMRVFMYMPHWASVYNLLLHENWIISDSWPLCYYHTEQEVSQTLMDYKRCWTGF